MMMEWLSDWGPLSSIGLGLVVAFALAWTWFIVGFTEQPDGDLSERRLTVITLIADCSTPLLLAISQPTGASSYLVTEGQSARESVFPEHCGSFFRH